MIQPAVTALQDERFLLVESLGRGGMARVFRAFDRVEQRLVALKVLHDDDPGGPGHPFAEEFDLWSRMRHPNVVQAHELRFARRGPIAVGTPYLVLEHVSGGPAHRMLRPGSIPPATLERLAVLLLRGLGHVHDAGLVHRDLKPANVLVAPDAAEAERVKLTDFGLATVAGSSEEPGCFSGSLPYASPEALLGWPLDGRADLYGLGILLYQLAAGELPAGRGGVDALMRWHLTGPPADPARTPSEKLRRFIRRLTTRNRDRRPRDTRHALELLGARPPEPHAGQDPGVPAATRARLRLALDAARLGALRTFRLPHATDQARALVREVRVWTQVRGLDFHRLAAGAASPARLVMRLLAERGNEPRRLVERFGLDRVLSLDLVGNLPLPAGPAGTNGAGRAAAAGVALCGFLLDCAEQRAMVLYLPRKNSTDPVGAALQRAFTDRARERCAPRTGRGGLLLLLGA